MHVLQPHARLLALRSELRLDDDAVAAAERFAHHAACYPPFAGATSVHPLPWWMERYVSLPSLAPSLPFLLHHCVVL